MLGGLFGNRPRLGTILSIVFFFRVGRVEQRVCPLKWTTIATLSVSPLLGKLGMQAVEPCHGHYDDVADHGLVKDGGDGERHDRIMPTR